MYAIPFVTPILAAAIVLPLLKYIKNTAVIMMSYLLLSLALILLGPSKLFGLPE